MKETLRTLVESFGPSGHESEIMDLIEDMIKEYVDDTYCDSIGNLIAVKKGTSGGKRIMFAAHADEIGVVVTHIDDNGFLRFASVGGLSPFTLPGNRVRFADGTIGVIGREKGDFKDITLDKLFIDIGVADKDEAAAAVQVGDFGIMHQECIDLGRRMTAKSMDDRIGCVVLIETIKKVQDTPHDLFFVFTAQEEVGIRGARTSAFAIEPDLGIAIDVTLTGDTPEAPRMEVSLGSGAAIKIKDSSLITHPKVKALMTRLAEAGDIAYQYEVLERGGTDAGAIHLSRTGVPSGTISIPCRYVHSVSEMVDKNDVQACIDLVAAICGDDLKELQ